MFGMCRLAGFIARHHLHGNGVPVSLASLIDRYDVRYVPFSAGVLGAAFFYKRLRIILVNGETTPYTQRMTLAHEVAHHALRHPNSYFECRDGGWWYDHLEMHAQHAAAVILIPGGEVIEYLAQGASTSELSHVFEVPESLVLMRVHMADCIPALNRDTPVAFSGFRNIRYG